MPAISDFRVTYGEAQYFVSDDGKGGEVITEFILAVKKALAGDGDLVLLEYDAGKVWLAIGAGIALAVDVFQHE